MSRAAADEVRAGFVKAKGAIHRVANFVGVVVFLPIVFPPADGTERHRARSFQRFESAAWAAIALFECSHLRMDENRGARVYFGCRMSTQEQGHYRRRGQSRPYQKRKTMPVVKRACVPPPGDWLGALM